ncbi:MAG: cupin domain-containing protein [Allosphingosinicella sp.]
MKTIAASRFRADAAWTGPVLGRFPDAAVKLRWTDRPFRWHRNAGPELFLVLAGAVDMHVRTGAGAAVEVVELAAGDMLGIEAGEEHVAHPRGEATILVIEGAGE